MRTRLPVKLKVAVLSAALTFAILCLFAVVVGTVAEQRIVAGFDDDLRASVGELQDRITLERAPPGDGVQLSASDRALLARLRSGRPDRAGRGPPTTGPIWPEDPTSDAGARPADQRASPTSATCA